MMRVMTNRRGSLLTRSAALTLFVIALPGIARAFDPTYRYPGEFLRLRR